MPSIHVSHTLVPKCDPRWQEWLYYNFFVFWWHCNPTLVMASSFLRFLDHTQWRTTVDRTPLDEWSARRRDLYLTTHNIHNRQTSMPAVGFEPTISAGERPQTYALDSAATGTGLSSQYPHEKKSESAFLNNDPRFPKELWFLKFPRLRPFVLLIREIYGWIWIWTIVGMILTGESLSRCQYVHQKY